MEDKKQNRTIPLDYIRGLLVEQGCRCAITGIPLDPVEVNADHIIPVSREDLRPSLQEDNIWLVHKRINAMKGTMTYCEFVEACQAVLDHHSKTNTLLDLITGRAIQPMSKAAFDNWVQTSCDADGKLKSEKSPRCDNIKDAS